MTTRSVQQSQDSSSAPAGLSKVLKYGNTRVFFQDQVSLSEGGLSDVVQNAHGDLRMVSMIRCLL